MSRKSVDKGLLNNIVRNTSARNKIQEQNEMWKQWELKRQSRNHSPVLKRRVSGYMRSDEGISSNINEESLKWNRLLMDYEEKCKDRWGHSGYKEMYPEEFCNHDSNPSDVESPECAANSNKKESTDVEPRAEKKKKKRKKSKQKKEKKKRKLSSDSDDSDPETDHKHKKRKSVSSEKQNRSNQTKSIKKKKEKY